MVGLLRCQTVKYTPYASMLMMISGTSPVMRWWITLCISTIVSVNVMSFSIAEMLVRAVLRTHADKVVSIVLLPCDATLGPAFQT